ncbi:DNA-binding response OmpR family regulator [Ruminococcaceae bacterium R-25]|jgi:DNA-binding response OmpR family regulator|nr:DNA-binding response OmpR family regulator [Ruminococcaceae bacterium R-25]SUQ22204.1 DNA-binding response regulator, OmpR family, contains REC and winged-helix (wHTH) domain [Oscillospiraceae bacterium]
MDSTSTKRLLIAEDDVSLRHITSAFFTKYGFEVDQASDGIEACGLVMQNHYDAIILDIMMPGKDGIEVCKFIRTRYDVPVIFLTALGTESDIIEGYEVGADEYVTKPFSTKLLLMKVNALINRYRGLLVKNGRITINEIVIEPFKRIVSVDGERLDISPREYELLLYFVENKEQVLSRDQILDAVWGEDFLGYDRAVDTYVKKLRQTLGKASYHIETVIKSGYMWRN